MYSINKPKAPFVYIAGSGPGKIELLTLKTFHLITKIADIVIYDRLIQKEIIDLIPTNVESIYAGKSCHSHNMTQEEINELLLKKSKENKVILRLKGGDPFIFGRGGEEANYLYKNNINFEIVPGITAAGGSAAYCNIPLTYRGISDSVKFITGHKKNNEPFAIEWDSLISKNTTIVVYMGLANLEKISNNLIKNGLDPNTPAVVIENGTTDQERVCLSNLKNIPTEVKKFQLKSPTIAIIGHVVLLSNTIKEKAINLE